MNELLYDLIAYFEANNESNATNEFLYRCKEEQEKQLLIQRVSSSALIDKAEQMQKENKYLVTEARGHWDKEYKKAIGIGIDRIIKLIKRHYC